MSDQVVANGSRRGLLIYIAVLLSIITLILLAFVAAAIYGSVRIKNESNYLKGQVNRLNTQINSVNANLVKINNSLSPGQGVAGKLPSSIPGL